MSKIFVIEGDRISNYKEFCEEFSGVVLSGKYQWNGNLDAFNDILRGGFGDIEDDESFSIIWKASDKSKESLGYPETIKLLEERLKRCHPSNREWVGEQLKQAKNGEGATIYDWLLEIIAKHENVTLNLE